MVSSAAGLECDGDARSRVNGRLELGRARSSRTCPLEGRDALERGGCRGGVTVVGLRRVAKSGLIRMSIEALLSGGLGPKLEYPTIGT